MEQSRVKKSAKNITVGFVCVFLNAIFTFITTSLFVKLLGEELNGVNRLFANILQVLSLADLGFATAVAYSLYKPMKDDDKEAVAALMNYFAKVYRVIALVVLVAGLCCIPFLQYLINENIEDLPFTLNKLRSYFALYLLNTVSSYLLAYKRTVLTADQNNYVVSAVDNVGNVVFNAVQIALLAIFKNYYLYLTVMVIKTVANNVIITAIANKKYPYLRQLKNVRITDVERKSLIRNVEAMFCHKIGGVAIYSTTTILISALVSVVDAGKYGNYILIVNQVSVFVNIIFSSLTSSIGNLCVSENVEYQLSVFKRILYFSNFIVIFVTTCFFGLFNDFVGLWLGEENVFPLYITAILSMSGASPYLRSPVNAFKEAKGLFKKDWFKPILEGVLGVALGILLSKFYGIAGIIAGYLISSLFVAMPIEDYVVFKYGFGKNALPHYLMQIFIFVISCAIAFAVNRLCALLPLGLGWFCLKAVICITIPIVLYLGVTFKTEEFSYYKALLLKRCRKR